ncbi:MAG: BrnT family toxin [Woeseia sp.]
MPDEFSVAEERSVLVGRDALGRVLRVSCTYRGNSIRIVSARPATKSERREYEKELRL